MFGRRRKRDIEGLAVQVAAARRAATAAEAAATQAARSASASVELLLGLEEHQMDPTPQRFRVYSVVCLVLGLAIVACTLLLPSAFADPSPSVSRPGSVRILVEGPEQEGSPATQAVLRSIVLETAIDEDDGSAAYTVWMPDSLEGREFKILLAGSAVLHDMAPIVHERFDVSEARCTDPEVIPNFYLEDIPCQVLTGQVGGNAHYPLQACQSDDMYQYEGDYFELTAWGASGVRDKIDWAHVTTNMPDTSGLGSENAQIDRWNGLQFETALDAAVPTVCQEVEFADSMTKHVGSNDPQHQWARGFEWGPGQGDLSFAVTSTRRTAGTIGNLLVAALGLFGAVLIGLIPVTIDARRSHRRYLRFTASAKK